MKFIEKDPLKVKEVRILVSDIEGTRMEERVWKSRPYPIFRWLCSIDGEHGMINASATQASVFLDQRTICVQILELFRCLHEQMHQKL